MKYAIHVALATAAIAATSCSGASSVPSTAAATSDGQPATALQTAPGATSQSVQASDARMAATVSDASVDADADAHAHLHPINAFNSSNVRARLHFRDDGTSLTVFGIAHGMDPTRAYVSLVYFTGSVADGTESGQCLPPPGNPLDSSHMLIAYWYPMTGTRDRVLYYSKTGPTSYVPLASIATTSVRWDTTPQVQPVVANPTRLVLQACGAVVPRGHHDTP